MPYKILTFLLIIILNSCVSSPVKKIDSSATPKSYFLNKGFTLVYNDKLYEEKLVKGKIEERSLTIFQKNLKEATKVKITNLINSKYIIANVGKKVEYPYFYNSVISRRISKNLEIDKLEPYVEIKELLEGSSFIAKKAKTFDEEKTVASKAPIDDIEIKNLSNNEKEKSKVNIKKFSYIIKIADFYFEKSADQMKTRFLTETSIKKVNINKLSRNKFRVYLGPFNNLNSLKNSFNAINVLQFDTIEIIKK
ncbi:MAG: hypothetical protein H8E55_55620 [Pelagibacterales bacterium]|nr:hypothetical protein [Pelagibacterales bacterium]